MNAAGQIQDGNYVAALNQAGAATGTAVGGDVGMTVAQARGAYHQHRGLQESRRARGRKKLQEMKEVDPQTPAHFENIVSVAN